MQGEYTDKHLRFRKYNPETGLIVDNCLEDSVLREMTLTSALAASGFRQAYTLSQIMGEAVPSGSSALMTWTTQFDSIAFARTAVATT